MDILFDEQQATETAKVNQEKAVQSKLESDYSKWEPRVRDICGYFLNCYIEADDKEKLKFQPLIGEQENGLTLFMAFLMAQQPVLIRSFAGTGKTVLMNVMYALTPEEQRYTVEMGSGTALWYQARDINEAKFIWFNELQNSADNEEVNKVLKLWGEGRSSHRGVTDITQRDEDTGERGVVDELVLDWHPFITSFAVGNKTAEKIYNDEFSRRVVELYTDVSSKQTEAIVRAFLKQWARGEEKVRFMTDHQIALLKYHVAKCIEKRDSVKKILFPGAEALIDGIPTTFVESRSAIKILSKIVEGYAVYHYKNRIVTKDGIMLAAPHDMYYAYLTYGSLFVQKCLRMGLLAKDVLNAMPEANFAGNNIDPNAYKGPTDLIQVLKDQKINIGKAKMQQVLQELEDNGLIVPWGGEEFKEKKYIRSGLGEFKGMLDWSKIVAQCRKTVEEDYPEYAKEYVEKFCTAPTLTHPTKPTIVTLLSGKEFPYESKW